MTIMFDSLLESNLSYSAIFACMGLGFLFLRRVDPEEVGPGYWALSFFLNSGGFFFWSGVIPLERWQYFLAGEAMHVLGFILLACGAYRFSGRRYRPWYAIAGFLWLLAWGASIALAPKAIMLSLLFLKIWRAVVFILTGWLIVSKKTMGSMFGKRVAGYSLIAWGLYTVLLTFVKIESFLHLAYGLLVGFQILSAFGMVAMVIDRIRVRAEESEKQVKRLEGLLPICSYCKKIRDKNNEWHTLELYIEERSKAEFSHGICPECFQKHRPDK